MDDKTPKPNETQQNVESQEQTKAPYTPAKTSVERQADIIVSGLERAKQNGGILLNQDQKLYPKFYQQGVAVSPYNAMLIAMVSDEKGYKTNDITLFSEAKKRNESIRGGEKGMPFSWYAWNEYVNKSNPEDKISRHDYKALSPDEQTKYKGVRSKETRIVFNIDQTTLPHVNKEAYETELAKNGNVNDREVSQKDDMKVRMSVNDFILNVRDNLVPIRKDGSGVASYDKQKDIVHIPAQNAYASYPEYVQDITRQVMAATSHPQRLNRHSSQNYDTLVTELGSATRQLELGMPAKLSDKAMQNIDYIISSIKANPKLAESLERDINASMGMMKKAANGEKVELRPTPKDMENWRSKLPQEGTVPDKFDAVLMLKDNNEKWSLYVKPENENGFAVHPEQKDVSMFFNVIRNNVSEQTETFRQELAQKYYAEVANNPDKAIDIFKSNATDADLARIEKVNIFKTKDDTPRILAVPVIDGERQKAREVSQDQWQRMWLAPDMQDYKKHLAATLYADVLKQEIKQSQQQSQQPEQKEEQQKPVTLDIPKWSLNYIINGDAEGITDEEKDIVDKFLDEHFADGFIPEVIEGKDKDFNISPAFGTRNPNALPNRGESPYQAVDTVAVKFSPAGYFETRNESEQKTYDPKDEQEDKECTKLLKQIEAIDKKCRAETQPNRQRALFLEKQALEAKLQERVKMLQEGGDKKSQETKKAEEQKKTEEQKTSKPKRNELSPLLKQFLDLKKKHPEALLLFRCGDFYETYKDDAEKASKILGITLTKSSKTKDDEGKPLAMAGFPYHALDTYLPKLIRAGQRVAICDQIEQPKQTNNRAVTNVQAEQEQKTAKEAPKAEEQETRSRGFHR